MGNESLLLQLVQEVRSELRTVSSRFDAMETRAEVFDAALAQHAQDSKAWHAAIAQAFPEGDMEAHRRYHQSIIEWRELRNKIVMDCLVNSAKAGFLAGSAWLLYAIWVAIKMELTQK